MRPHPASLAPISRLASAALAAGLLLALPHGARAAGDAPAAAPANFGVRLYELYELGPELRLDARTSRRVEPHHARELAAGQVFPPADQPAMKVAKVRGHRAFLGGLWREDGTPDGGRNAVLVTEEGSEPGYAMVRLKVVPREEATKALHADAASAMSSAAKVEGPLWGARLYECYMRDGEVVLQERTTRAFGPQHVRNIPAGTVHPAAGQDPMELARSRDSLGFWGAAWREDGEDDKEASTAVVVEEAGAPNTALTRVRLIIVPTKETPPAPRRDPFPKQQAAK